MNNKTITVCYRKIIDASSNAAWEKLVFEDSYMEFTMQAQAIDTDKKYNTYAQLLANVKRADTLNHLVSAAVVNYLRQLNGKIPDVIDNLGRLFLPFTNFQFEIINSDITDKLKHHIAVNFYSEPLIWHETVGSFMLVSNANLYNGIGDTPTNLFAIQPYLSISSLKTAP